MYNYGSNVASTTTASRFHHNFNDIMNKTPSTTSQHNDNSNLDYMSANNNGNLIGGFYNSGH